MLDSKPFEIRASLLHLAKDMLSENMHTQIQATESTKTPLGQAPQYTAEQIIAEAEKFYAFVSKK